MPLKDNYKNKDETSIKVLRQFKQLWFFLSEKRKKQLILLLTIQIFSALADTIPIYLIGPVTKQITNIGNDNSFINGPNFLSKIDPIFLLIVFIFLVIFSSLIKLLSIYLCSRMSAVLGNDISNVIYLKTISQSYSVHLNRNSSEIIAALSIQLNMVVGNIFRFFQFVSSTINSLFIISVLILINWKINLIILLIICFLYLIIAFYTKKKLRLNSQLIAEMLKVQIKEVKEGLGSIKDIIINNSFKYFRKNFNEVDRDLRFAKAENLFLSTAPRYFIEAAGISLLILFLLLFKVSNTDYKIIPILATLAFGSQKLLPELQKAYQAWAKFFSVSSTFEIILKLMSQNHNIFYKSELSKSIKDFKSICFKNVSFHYQKQDKYLEVISDLNFKIKKGERIGIVGKSGSGKSTIANLIMSIFEPNSGEILVNNKNLYSDDNKEILYEWRKLISHVPQDPYLLDKSIAENIAFGIPLDQIDLNKVKIAAKQAYISDFIETLPKKYFTKVGDNGLRVSGGQKQRIAIARAIFKNSKFILFDEATSALDNSTEENILSIIYGLNKEVTVVLLAHRLSTLRECSRIIEINGYSDFQISETQEFFKKIKK